MGFLKIKVFLSYFLLMLITIMGGWVVYSEVQSYRLEDKMKSAHTDVVAQVNGLLTELFQAEGLLGSQQNSNYGRQYSSYKTKMDAIVFSIDSLASTVDNPVLKQDLDSIKHLLQIKRKNQKELLLMQMPNSIDSLYVHAKEKLDTDADSSAVDVEILKNQTVYYDTTYHKHEKMKVGKGFKRLFNIHEKTIDSTLQVTISRHMHIDSIVNRVDKRDSIVNLLIGIIEDIKQENLYAKRLRRKKEHKVINSNLELTSQLRHLLANIEEDQIDEAYNLMQGQQKHLLRARRILVFFGVLAVLAIVFFVVNILNDITKTQKYRRDLEAAKAKVEALLKNKEMMMLSLSHDLKSPINAIMGYAKLLQQDKGHQDTDQYLDSILQSSAHITNLVEDLLNLAKLEQGKLQLNKMPFDFNQLLHESVATFNGEAKARHIRLSCSSSIASAVHYDSDPVRLKQILNNLVSNALKFTYKGAVEIKAEQINKGALNEAVRISVSDTGIGIPTDVQKHLFEPFNRGQIKDYQIKGTGLGLAITKRIVELLKGSISLESTVDKGSCFAVTLPLAYANTKGDSNESIESLGGTGKHCVWLVDDDETFLKMMATVLRIGKLDVKSFTNPQAALEAYQPNSFDLLVTDLQMPTMCGSELLKQINVQSNEPVRAIAITGMNQASEYIDTSQFTNILAKPFLPQDLLRAISKVLGIWVEPTEVQVEQTYCSVQKLIAFADGDKKQEQEIIKAFLKNEKLNVKQLVKHINLVNVNGISDLAHKMLNIYRQLNTDDMVDLLVQLEEKNFDVLSRKEYFDIANQTVKRMTKVIKTVESNHMFNSSDVLTEA